MLYLSRGDDHDPIPLRTAHIPNLGRLVRNGCVAQKLRILHADRFQLVRNLRSCQDACRHQRAKVIALSHFVRPNVGKGNIKRWEVDHLLLDG